MPVVHCKFSRLSFSVAVAFAGPDITAGAGTSLPSKILLEQPKARLFRCDNATIELQTLLFCVFLN